MVNAKNLLFVCAFLMSQAGFAANVKIVESEAPAPAQMQSGTMYFSYKTVPFKDWKAGAEKQALNLFPTFRDSAPSDVMPLNMFIGKTSIVIDKPANQIDLAKFNDMGKLQELQSDLFTIKPINSAELNTSTEKFLAYRNPAPNQTWCSDPKSICMRSEFILDEQVQFMISGMFFVMGKDDGPIRTESQFRLMSADEITNKPALKTLTGIAQDPTALIQQDFFWFSNAVEFGKVVAVVQPHPTDPNKSILTGFMVFGIESKWWNFGFKGFTFQDAILGKRFNSSTGITQGLPKVTQGLFSKIMGEL